LKNREDLGKANDRVVDSIIIKGIQKCSLQPYDEFDFIVGKYFRDGADLLLLSFPP
jgi:hypothetical protein